MWWSKTTGTRSAPPCAKHFLFRPLLRTRDLHEIFESSAGLESFIHRVLASQKQVLLDMPPSLPSKKRKTREADDTLRTIQDLEKQLTTAVSNGSSLNPLADLLDIALDTESHAHLSKAIYALYRVFVVIITNGLLSGPDRTEEAKAVRAWLLERLHSFVDLLASLLKDEETSLKVCLADLYPFRIPQLTHGADLFSRHLDVSPEAPLFLPHAHW